VGGSVSRRGWARKQSSEVMKAPLLCGQNERARGVTFLGVVERFEENSKRKLSRQKQRKMGEKMPGIQEKFARGAFGSYVQGKGMKQVDGKEVIPKRIREGQV